MHLVDPGARRASNPGSEARDPAEERGPLSLPGYPGGGTAAEARERIRTLVYDDHDALGIAVAHRIAALIREYGETGFDRHRHYCAPFRRLRPSATT